MLRIQVSAHADSGRPVRQVFGSGEHLIGRDADCDLVVDSPAVSLRHARLSIRGDDCWLEDLGSRNGCFVNGQRITERTRIHPPQSVSLGSALLEIDPVAPDQSSATLCEDQPASDGLLPHASAKNRYTIGPVVNRGGMGAILEVQDLQIDRRVAMKVMLSGKGASRESLLRFIQEAKVTGRLEHPNIVPIHDLGVDPDGRVYYTMKFVRGATLHQVLTGIKEGKSETIGQYSLSHLLTIFQKVCDAVAFAHSKGVLHRDLKPENVMIGEFGEVQVMDWGLAKVREFAESGEDKQQREAGVVPLEMEGSSPAPGQNLIRTLEGRIMGSPNFMAPEQAAGRVSDIDERTDIYALGGILYSILALRPPVAGPDLRTIFALIRAGDTRPPTAYNDSGTFPHCPAGKIPAPLSAVAMKALAVRPKNRYGSVPELQSDIGAYQNGFATLAEQAGLFTLAGLWMKRHRVASAASAIVALTVAGASVTVLAMWLELRGTASTFYDKSVALVSAQQFGDALAPIDYAIRLDRKSAGYLLLRGHILQCLLRIQDARNCYEEVLRLVPNHLSATENLKLCDSILAAGQGKRELSSASLFDLQAAVRGQAGRIEQANAILQLLLARDEATRKRLYEECRSRLDHAGIKGDLKVEDDGRVRFQCTKTPLRDLSPLRGLPLNSLSLSNCEISNINALAGMPLDELELEENPVADLTPLKGMKLKRLTLSRARVGDLRPLTGMPLEFLFFQASTAVTDLRPLIGLPLQELGIGDLKVRNIDALRGMSLRRLFLGGIPLQDLSFLRDMPLVSLSLDGTSITDLGPLRGFRLYDLFLRDLPITDLSPLRGIPLKILYLDHSKARDLSPLAGMALTELHLNSLPVVDFTPLAGMPLQLLFLGHTQIRDLTVLRGMPLDFLTLDGCANLQDLHPLTELHALKRLVIPVHITDIEFLRQMPTIEKIGYYEERLLPTTEFWKAFDARKQAQKAK